MRNLINFLAINFSNGVQMFNTRNTVGDEMETIYDRDGITVDICYDWGYIEIFGLTDEEFETIVNLYDGEPFCEIPQIKEVI